MLLKATDNSKHLIYFSWAWWYTLLLSTFRILRWENQVQTRFCFTAKDTTIHPIKEYLLTVQAAIFSKSLHAHYLGAIMNSTLAILIQSSCLKIRASVKFIQRTIHCQGQWKGAGQGTLIYAEVTTGKQYLMGAEVVQEEEQNSFRTHGTQLLGQHNHMGVPQRGLRCLRNSCCRRVLLCLR